MASRAAGSASEFYGFLYVGLYYEAEVGVPADSATCIQYCSGSTPCIQFCSSMASYTFDSTVRQRWAFQLGGRSVTAIDGCDGIRLQVQYSTLLLWLLLRGTLL